MSRRDDSSGDLSDVRREIDEIDDAILDLLKRRFGVVARVKAIKGLDGGTPGTPMRPAREAQVIRRLVASAGGQVPGTVVARLWMELIASASRFQSPITLHLPSCSRRIDYQDLIRFHTGAGMSVVDHELAASAIEAAARSPGNIALCPLDTGDGSVSAQEEQAMQALVRASGEGVQVVARLPFIMDVSPVEGLIAGQVPFEPSGDDVTLYAVRGRAPDPAEMRQHELNADHAVRSYSNGAFHIVAVIGYIEPGDERIGRMAGDWQRIGGYARAIDLGDS